MVTNYHIPDNDPDLIGLTFTDIQITKPEFVRCTRKQRETLELIMRDKHMSYKEMVMMCGNLSKHTGMKGIGELSKGEAGMVIRVLGGREE